MKMKRARCVVCGGEVTSSDEYIPAHVTPLDVNDAPVYDRTVLCWLHYQCLQTFEERTTGVTARSTLVPYAVADTLDDIQNLPVVHNA